jgi:uncharacterized protein (DUF58 family)
MTLISHYFQPRDKGRAELTLVRRRPSWDASVTGLFYCCLMMFMGLAAINTQASLLFGVFGMMIGILLVSGVISRLVLKKVTITRDLPECGTVGVPLAATYRFKNAKRYWPSFSITLTELDGAEGFARQPQSYLLHAAAGERVTVPVELLPKRRGIYEFNEYQIATSFPFGFMKRAADRSHPDKIVLYPPVGTVSPRVLAMCLPADNFGPARRPRRGGADELYGLKDYRRGDNPRLIYWKRSARTGTLVSREMTQVAPPRMLILIDTFLPARTRIEHASVERAVAMAASVASLALEQGLAVGVRAWGGGEDDPWLMITPTRGKRQRRDVMTLLARLPINTTTDTRTLVESGQRVLDPGTTAVLCTGKLVELGLMDHVRGSLVVLSAMSPATASLFQFPPGVRFDRCFPGDQEAGIVDPDPEPQQPEVAAAASPL